MSVWEVQDGLDVWGNPVDGYEVNNAHRGGFLTIRDDWDQRRIIEVLVKHDYLNRGALEMFDAGELDFQDGDSMELAEREEAWAHSPPGEEPRFIDAHDGRTAEQVAEDDGEGPPEEYELVVGWHPVLIISPLYSEGKAKPFWRDNVLSGNASHRKEHRVLANVELRIDPEKPAVQRAGRGQFQVEVWVDGEFFGERDFPFDCQRGYELGLAAHGGNDPEKYVPLVDAPDDCKEMEVALDWFFDHGGVAGPQYLKVKPYEEIVRGRQRHYPELISLAYRDGVDDGSVNWDHEYTADDIVAIRRDARAWAEQQVGDPDADSFMADVRADYPMLSEPQFQMVQQRYRDGVITGLTSSALAYSQMHGDQLLADQSEPHQIRDDWGLLFLALPRGTPLERARGVLEESYVLELDDNVLDASGTAVRHWHDAGVEDWDSMADLDFTELLEPQHFILPSRGVMTDSRGEFDVYELQDIEVA